MKRHHGAKLAGKWFGRVDGSPVGLEFKDDGRLAYVVLDGNRQQTVLMVYRIEGDELVTDQPPKPREERTRFRVDASGVLELEFGGAVSKFVRQ